MAITAPGESVNFGIVRLQVTAGTIMRIRPGDKFVRKDGKVEALFTRAGDLPLGLSHGSTPVFLEIINDDVLEGETLQTTSGDLYRNWTAA